MSYRVVFIAAVLFICIFTFEASALPPNANERDDVFEMAQAVRHFINEFFQKKTDSLLLKSQSIDDSNAKYYIFDLIDEVLRTTNELKIELNAYSRQQQISFDYCFYILIVDSYEAFRLMDIGFREYKYRIDGYYLIVLGGSSPSHMVELQKIFDYCWSHRIINVDVLVASVAGNELYSYDPFTETHCHRAIVQRLNLNRSMQQLNATELFPSKVDNFRGCSLTAAIWQVPPYLILPEGNNRRFAGMEGELLSVISDTMNFTIAYIVPANDEQRGEMLPNGSLTGAMRLLTEKSADLSLGSFRCTMKRSIILTPSINFYQTVNVISMLNVREPWTSYEILAYAFNIYVWIILFAFVLFILLFQCTMRCLRIKTLLRLGFNYRRGRSAHVVINLVGTFFGLPSFTIPKHQFLRFLLIEWLFLTMVLRSSYQGRLYDFLSSQKTPALPNTIRNFRLKHYTLIVNIATSSSFKEFIDKNRIDVLVMNISDSGAFPILEQRQYRLHAAGTPRDFLTYYVKTQHRFGVFHIVREPVFIQQLCMYYRKGSYLKAKIDEILGNLIAFGLIDHWASEFIDEKFLSGKYEIVKGSDLQIPLGMDKLYGIFVIQGVLYGMAAIIFLGELMWKRLKNRFRNDFVLRNN